jgi:acetolactate synthase I/II/III large subunit
MYTTATAFLDALNEGGVSHLFANFGSDHPAIIESLVEAKTIGRPAPKVITCPNEMVALSAAHGFAQITGRAQAVLVHVECGTQSLGGAVHNASRGRVPVLIFAGASPFTQEGEMRGSRNEFIHWLQDVFDQRGIVRGYVKYDNEIRTGQNIKQIVHRALQFANSEPKGPVYLMAAREVMEQEVPRVSIDPTRWPALSPCPIASSDVVALVRDLVAARRPLVVTSYLGRNPKAVEELVLLCRRYAVGVLESAPGYMNFPSDDPMYVGNQGNEQRQNVVLGEADFILLLDTDIPWIPAVNRPQPRAKIYQIDIDPLKEQMPLWQVATERALRADAATALRQIVEFLETQPPDFQAVDERRRHYTSLHDTRLRELRAREALQPDVITPECLTAGIRRFCDPETIVLNEGVTNYTVIGDHIGVNQPARMFTSGGSSLGWNGGAAIGMKLACPEKTVLCLTGDGSYMFSQPSTVHWIARRYQTPILQVIYNNGGWKAPRFSTLAVHPSGYASRAEDIGVSFDPPPDYGGIAAAAGGAFAQIVRHPEELNCALEAAFKAVREERRSAVLDVWLPHL